MNILLTSAGRRSYLVKYFRDALNGKGRVYASNSEYTIALQEADGYFICPLIYEPEYVDSLIDFCQNNDIRAIISVFDIDLLVLSQNKEKIESKGIKLLLSHSQVVEVCNDKWKTYEFIKSIGLKTPTTHKSLETVHAALNGKEIDFPIIIKPRWGMASIGIYEVHDEEELAFFYKKTLNEIQSSYLRFESGLTPEEMILFQEKLKGQEYGLDIINDLQGNYVGVYPKSKIRMRAGETDLGQTVSPVKFEETARKLSNVLKHEVILSVDCFDVSGEIYILEMNCRISGHYPLSHLAGINLPKQIIAWLNNEETHPENFLFREGLYITKDLEPVILNKHE